MLCYLSTMCSYHITSPQGFLMLTNSLHASNVYLYGCNFTLNLECICMCYRYVWHLCQCLCKKCQGASMHFSLWMCHYLLYVSFSCMSLWVLYTLEMSITPFCFGCYCKPESYLFVHLYALNGQHMMQHQHK